MDEVKLEKNRKERRKEASLKRSENRKLKRMGEGYSWRLAADGEWCWCYDELEDKRVK